MDGIARIHPKRLRLVLATTVIAVAATWIASPIVAAATTYGPGSPGWDAYYADPLDTATWAPFCSGAGATYVAAVGVPVPACGPTGSTQIDIPLSYPYTSGGETTTVGFQCVELVERYLYAVDHWGAQAGDGAQMAGLYGSAHGINPVLNSTGQAPQVGNVISFSVESDFSTDMGTYPGHVGIVTASNVNSSGNGSITILSENWSGTASTMSLTVTNWTVPAIQTQDSSGNSVTTPYVEWLPVGTPPPAVAGVQVPGSSPSFSAAACYGTTSCVAVGNDSSGGPLQPLLVTGSGISWKATNPPLPASANLGGSLESVACPTASSCAAVGWADASGSDQALVETPSGSSWVPTEPSLPPNSQAPSDASLAAVACFSATSCTAAGFYTDNTVATQPLLESGSGVNWTPYEPSLPSSLGQGWTGQLSAIICPPSGTSCVAAGDAINPTSGMEEGLLETGSSTTWTPWEAPLPANAAASPSVLLDGVACPSATECVVVGQYNDSSGHTDGLLLTGFGKQWTTAEEPLPSGVTGASSGGLKSVVCPVSAGCGAASWYSDSSGNYHALLVTGLAKSWTPAQPVLPSGASTAQLQAVACYSSAITCLAVGNYRDSSGDYQGLMTLRSGSSWQSIAAPLPTNAGPPVDLQQVSCPSAVACVAFGESQTEALVEIGL